MRTRTGILGFVRPPGGFDPAHVVTLRVVCAATGRTVARIPLSARQLAAMQVGVQQQVDVGTDLADPIDTTAPPPDIQTPEEEPCDPAPQP